MKNKKFKIVRYFDTYLDGIEGYYDSEEEAKKICKELNSKEKRPHVDYTVRINNSLN